jgi:choline-sulfatase
VGYASAGHFETPHLDELARRGVIFDTAYSAATICVPARTALLTGLQPHRLPTQENRFALREGFWTVAHELRQAGYQTALVGKMHFAPVHADHGFETMRLCEHLSGQGLGPISRARGDVTDDYHQWLLAEGLPDHRLDGGTEPASPLPAHAHPTEWVAREAAEVLSHRDPNRPLFLVVSFPHPHAPYDPPEPYASMYDPADSILPEGGYELNARLGKRLGFSVAASPTRAEAGDQRAVRGFLATVRGLVKQIDDAMGRVLGQLDLGSTLVLFTSDHGDYAGHRGLMRKTPWVPFDDLARVPFVVAGGPVVGSRRVTDLVQSCDLALTCLDVAGVEPPTGVDFSTRSLRPILEDPAASGDPDRAVYSATSLDWPMVRVGRHKLLRFSEEGPRVLLDLVDDPDERVNRVADPALQDVRADLDHRLAATLREPVLDITAPV